MLQKMCVAREPGVVHDNLLCHMIISYCARDFLVVQEKLMYMRIWYGLISIAVFIMLIEFSSTDFEQT